MNFSGTEYWFQNPLQHAARRLESPDRDLLAARRLESTDQDLLAAQRLESADQHLLAARRLESADRDQRLRLRCEQS